jgi:hypothetical protein
MFIFSSFECDLRFSIFLFFFFFYQAVAPDLDAIPILVSGNALINVRMADVVS